MSKKKLLVLTGGGDCPGLNAVIRGIVKAAASENSWEVWGSIEAFHGLTSDPVELVHLTPDKVAGIHVKGGTILKTTNKGNPFNFPVKQKDGTTISIDISQNIINRLKEHNFEAVINIGGDGSQRISQNFFERGVNIVGVPKTIDNDLSCTERTFGFTTAVQIATDAFDKLVTTAESHHRVMILEVMGRDAGWIALHTAIAGGAEICLIPEIPYDINKLVQKINSRYNHGRGFVNIVVAEGAKPIEGEASTIEELKEGKEHKRLGGFAYRLAGELKDAGCEAEIREAVLGHIQRGGTPVAYDRILATLFGVKAYELVKNGDFGQMVALKKNNISHVSIAEAISTYNYIKPENYLVKAAKKMGVEFGNDFQ